MTRSTPLRLLYVVHGFPPESWAGTEVYALELARAMQARGHEVTVLARSPGEPNPPGPQDHPSSGHAGESDDLRLTEETFQGLRVLRLVNRLAYARLRETYSHPAVEAVFEQVLASVRPSVVHFQHLLHLSAGLVECARAAGARTVVTCHDYWALCARVQLIRPDGVLCESNQGMGCYVCLKFRDVSRVPLARRWLPWVATPLAPLVSLLPVPTEPLPPGAPTPLTRRLHALRDVHDRQKFVLGMFRRADLLISPSRFLREKLLASGQLDAQRFIASANGMSTGHLTREEKLADPEGRLRVGFVGSLVWYKGVDVLVRAMGELTGRRVTLSIHGPFRPTDDDYHRELERLAQGAAVEFHGPFPNADLGQIHRTLDVLVVPSVWYENAPLTIQEAFLLGTPVVVSDLGGMAEHVLDGENGLLFRPGDAQDLARQLARLVEEPGLLAALAPSGEGIKSIDENAQELEERYRGLLDGCLPEGRQPSGTVPVVR